MVLARRRTYRGSAVAFVIAVALTTQFSALAASRDACLPASKSPLVISVKDKGAEGDGKTDDTAAI